MKRAACSRSRHYNIKDVNSQKNSGHGNRFDTLTCHGTPILKGSVIWGLNISIIAMIQCIIL